MMDGPRRSVLHIQKWAVRLAIRDGQELWLAYDAAGRIGNANFDQAFRYDTRRAAEIALKRVRRDRDWPNAKIFGVLEEKP